MWKRVGLLLAVAWVGLGAERAEARFGKGSTRSSSSSSPTHSASPVGSRPPGRVQVQPGPPSTGYFGYPYDRYYFDPSWRRYYYDPAWAWPYLGPPTPYFGRYYDLSWRRRPRLVPMGAPEARDARPVRVDMFADGGVVSQGYSVGVGMRLEGERLGFGAKLNVFDLATDDGSDGRDTLTLTSLHPSVSLVSNDTLRLRVSGGVDIAFAPDVAMVGPGVGTSAELKLVGPLRLEASAQWTPLPFTQLGGDMAVAVDLGTVRLRAGYRSTYLNDQGRVDGIAHTDLLAGPYGGLSLRL